jgi:hypothetical protein
LGVLARKVPIQLLNYLTFCKLFIAKELRAIRDALHSRAASSGGVGINHLGNLALKIINRIRPQEFSA